MRTRQSLHQRIKTTALALATLLGLITTPQAHALVGGHDAYDAAPWAGYLVHQGATLPVTYGGCMVTLIDPTWVLTSAGCVYNYLRFNPITQQYPVRTDNDGALVVTAADLNPMEILLGSADLTDPLTERFGVAEIVFHPGFLIPVTGADAPSYPDAALIRLDHAATQAPIALGGLPFSGFVPVAGTTADVFGFGVTHPLNILNSGIDPTGERTTTLQQARVTLANCRLGFPEMGFYAGRCAHALADRVNACYGDDGAPLVATDPATGSPTLVGIRAMNTRSCRPTDGVTALPVENLASWIEATLYNTPPNTPDPAGQVDINCTDSACTFDAANLTLNGETPTALSWSVTADGFDHGLGGHTNLVYSRSIDPTKTYQGLVYLRAANGLVAKHRFIVDATHIGQDTPPTVSGDVRITCDNVHCTLDASAVRYAGLPLNDVAWLIGNTTLAGKPHAYINRPLVGTYQITLHGRAHDHTEVTQVARLKIKADGSTRFYRQHEAVIRPDAAHFLPSDNGFTHPGGKLVARLHATTTSVMVTLQRYYPGTGFKHVIRKTANAGQTLTLKHTATEPGRYRYRIKTRSGQSHYQLLRRLN